jgi:hypothetical protein
MPLFENIDKDRALEFSLFGKLKLDEKSQTSLCVDNQLEKGYRIEVGRDTGDKAKGMTFDRFVKEVKPTAEQKRIIDSLLELTGRRIESSVLIGENNSMAIAPDLPKLNRIMVANIASCLGPSQQASFRRLLEANDAPYTVRVPQGRPSGRHFLQNIPRSPHGNRFVIVTPDTMVYSSIHVDFDSLRRRMAEDFTSFQRRREVMLRKMMEKEFRYIQQRNPDGQLQSGTLDGVEFFSIEITGSSKDIQSHQMQVMIQPRTRRRSAAQESSFHIELNEDSAATAKKIGE